VLELKSNPTPALSRLLLTARQASEALSISERTLWSITVPRGPLPVVKVGRSVRYCPTDLDAWIELQKQKSGSV